jgi:hypothetical protein
MREPRFKVGDKITYKKPKDCPEGRYTFGGEYPKESSQKIRSYMEYIASKNCWKIDVDHDHGNYYMMEDEFLEYDSVPTEVSNYSVF